MKGRVGSGIAIQHQAVGARLETFRPVEEADAEQIARHLFVRHDELWRYGDSLFICRKTEGGRPVH
jgi:hypothetical protein